ncbi:hypothetical protein Vadar_021061 [Vaccinium darrowii]|uniref:Uncharacterized protein n=1 Tax=Vaccinium darrowii TaxID=229202 RepID=A0ACB7ZD07_9ERIC|nr:hypothetical protein Vadar_021061 [Vaccinium darrowii]
MSIRKSCNMVVGLRTPFTPTATANANAAVSTTALKSAHIPTRLLHPCKFSRSYIELNHNDVLVVVDSKDYPELLGFLQRNQDDQQFRRRLASKAFQHVASYDSAVSEWLRKQTVGAWKDAVEEACESGIGVIAEPGGSIRDGDAIDCCNKYGVSLLFTNASSAVLVEVRAGIKVLLWATMS